MTIRFDTAMRERIFACISRINKEPTPENVETQVHRLSGFFESHITGLVAEIDLVGSAFEKSKSEALGDPDQVLEKISRLEKTNEELEIENKNLRIQKEKAESQLRNLEENSQELSKADKTEKLENLLKHYKKENTRLKNIIEDMEKTGEQASINSLNQRINALDLELDQVIQAIEDKDAELEKMSEMYRSAEFAHAEREINFKKLIERLEKKLAAEKFEKNLMAEEGAKELEKILPPEDLEKYLAANKSHNPTTDASSSKYHEPGKKAYPPICGWQVYYNESKGSFYAKRSLFGKLPLNLYVGKNLSPSVILRTIPKIRKQEGKHGLSAMPLSPNDLSLEVRGDSP